MAQLQVQVQLYRHEVDWVCCAALMEVLQAQMEHSNGRSSDLAGVEALADSACHDLVQLVLAKSQGRAHCDHEVLQL
jgi:hypothetical protein